jgi:hypothetical protein
VTDPNLAARAQQLLENSLEQINALRNANVRDSNFKEWRQSTLTLFQRLWSGDDIRSERFRRIPFSPPSSRADSKTVRDWFEKGAAEAAGLIRMLIDEVAESGITESSGESRPARLNYESSEPPREDSEPTSDYEGTSIPRVSPPSSPSRASRSGHDAPPARPSRPAETSRRESPPDRSAQERETRESRPSKSGGKSHKKNVGKGRLKDMLGFDDEGESLATPPPPPEPPARTPSHPSRPMPGTRIVRSESGLPQEHRLEPSEPQAPRARDEYERRAPERPTPPPEPRDEMPHGVQWRKDELDLEPEPEKDAEVEVSESSLQFALDSALEMDNASDDSSEASEISDAREAEEFLGNSPVFRSKGRPVKRKGPAPAPAQARSAAGAAVLAIASEIAAMGVPENHRPRARAALLDLAHHLDRHDLTWQAMREAVDFIMQYPPIARRVLPLLLPYLEDAA